LGTRLLRQLVSLQLAPRSVQVPLQ
jgi:hypothetical protein